MTNEIQEMKLLEIYITIVFKGMPLILRSLNDFNICIWYLEINSRQQRGMTILIIVIDIWCLLVISICACSGDSLIPFPEGGIQTPSNAYMMALVTVGLTLHVAISDIKRSTVWLAVWHIISTISTCLFVYLDKHKKPLALEKQGRDINLLLQGVSSTFVVVLTCIWLSGKLEKGAVDLAAKTAAVDLIVGFSLTNISIITVTILFTGSSLSSAAINGITRFLCEYDLTWVVQPIQCVAMYMQYMLRTGYPLIYTIGTFKLALLHISGQHIAVIIIAEFLEFIWALKELVYPDCFDDMIAVYYHNCLKSEIPS